MQRMIKKYLWLAVLTAGAPVAWGFALLGPIGNAGDSWQTPTIGYGLSSDIGAPKALGQEYRYNCPVIYYAFDGVNGTFESYFGSNGLAAVDSAFAILNQSFNTNPLTGQYLTNGVDGYTTELGEYPMDSQSFNYKAQALGLTDLKSSTLLLLTEQMGLAQPERFVWTLHDRYLPPGGACPANMLYTVVQRNIDPLTSGLGQIQYSSYVNNTLYSYVIDEVCLPPNPLAVTVPFSPDPYADTYTAVAGLGAGLGVDVTSNAWGTVMFGGFYNGLTRDDVGGLRYLLSTNNLNYEDPTTGSLLQQTNMSQQVALYTADLGALIASSKTNAPVTLAALFPGLMVAGSSNYLTVVTNPIVVSYYINDPGAPAGTPPHLVVRTNGYTRTPMTNYVTAFANVVITTNWFANSYRTNTSAQLMTVTVTPFQTNVTFKQITLTNVPSGDYYLIPSGTCGFNIPNPQPSPGFPIEVVTATTNLITAASTNVNTGGTNLQYSTSQSIVIYVTNHIFQAYACSLVPNATGYYQGIQRIQFVRVPSENIDPLTFAFKTPITNTYSMMWFNPTNSTYSPVIFQRIVTQPDILFGAADMASPTLSGEIGVDLGYRSINFDQNNINGIPGFRVAGPGTINPPAYITFNEVGDIYGNGSLAEAGLATSAFLSQYTQFGFGLLAWGSFDGSTNDPVVYPNGTSIQNLMNQLIISITPTSLPDGTNGVAYPAVTFAATGGQPPYSWSLAGTQLPAGLVFSNGMISGTPAGNPPGIYDFKIQMTTADNRVVTLNNSITIH